ncbi:unnamed protein product, partial [marine sediment metagenome]
CWLAHTKKGLVRVKHCPDCGRPLGFDAEGNPVVGESPAEIEARGDTFLQAAAASSCPPGVYQDCPQISECAADKNHEIALECWRCWLDEYAYTCTDGQDYAPLYNWSEMRTKLQATLALYTVEPDEANDYCTCPSRTIAGSGLCWQFDVPKPTAIPGVMFGQQYGNPGDDCPLCGKTLPELMTAEPEGDNA